MAVLNILHLKYAVEVEKTHSISRAAENLYMGQPNLSRAIRELEESLGITIFDRTTRGITVTPQGEEFLQYARKILAEIDAVEAMYRDARAEKQAFSVSVPRATYVSTAFTEFAKTISTERPAEIFYKETNAMRAISNILQADYRLGIIRYQTTFEQYFQALLIEKGLSSEVLLEFSYVALMAKNHPLADRGDFRLEELSDYIEIAHADPYVPSLPLIDVKRAELSEHVNKRIFVFERASQFELLANVPNTFMWVSPMPEHLLKKHGLIQKQSSRNTRRYKDVLIYKRGYHFTELDKRFVEEVRKHSPQNTVPIRFENGELDPRILP